MYSLLASIPPSFKTAIIQTATREHLQLRYYSHDMTPMTTKSSSNFEDQTVNKRYD